MIVKKIIFIFYICITHINCEPTPTYSILAPKIIRPRSEYNIIIGLDDIKAETIINCSLTKSNGGTSSSITVTSIFNPTKNFNVLTLTAGNDFTPGIYDLQLSSFGELKINNILKIEFVYKQFVILIQSDKAIYKPGQDVLFRVVILDDLLKPVSQKDIEDLKIYIIDPIDIKLMEFDLDLGSKTEKINQINKFNYSHGVTDDMVFKLHDSARLGEWKLQAITKGQVQNYTFYVDNYVLPLANVTLKLPKFIETDNPILDYKINAFYTFGKPVNGQVEIIIEKIKDCGNSLKTNFKSKYEIKGIIKKEINLTNTPLHLSNCNEMVFNFSVNVYDNITKSVYSNWETFNVMHTNIKAEILDKRSRIRPFHTVTNEITLTSRDGEPIALNIIQDSIRCDADMKIKNSNGSTKGTLIKSLKYEGRLICHFATDNSFREMNMRVLYRKNNMDIILENTLYDFENGCKNDYIQVELQTRQKLLTSGDTTKLIVTSNIDITNLIYFIVIRGSIFKTKNIHFNEKRKMQTFDLELTREMVPESIIAVYMKSSSGVIVSDSLKMSVTGIFHNEVKLNITTPKLDANESAVFSVYAEPGSSLFFLATDVALNAIRQGNDITPERVLNDFYTKSNIEAKYDGFSQSGMNLLTNAAPECVSPYSLNVIEPVDPIKNQKGERKKVRKDFRETWIWDRTQLSSKKSLITLKDNVPDSITTWKITAFALDEIKGLGLTKDPGYITVFRPFFVKLNLPYSIKRFEDSDIHLIIFNYMNESIDATLKVSLNHTQDKNFITLDNCDQNIRLEKDEIKTVICKVTSKSVGRFGIQALITGKGRITNQKMNEDGELRELLVEYEGFSEETIQDVYFDLIDTKSLHYIIPNNLPTNAISGSEKLFMSATTELIQIQNTNTNIKYDLTPPDGCCQQMVASFFPKLSWIEYLNITHKAQKEDFNSAARDAQLAVPKLCWHKDSNSVYAIAFDGGWTLDDKNIDLSPSVWQTAYSVKMLWKAKRLISISDELLFGAKNWLKSICMASGEYRELHPNPIYSTGTNAYTTSFVHTVLHELGEINPNTDKWLEATYKSFKHPLDIMSSCYTLHLIDSIHKDDCYVIIQKLMQNSTEGKFWLDSKGLPDIHLTSYGLMILSYRKSYANALDVFNYVLKRQTTSIPYGNSHITYTHNSYIQVLIVEAMTKFIEIITPFQSKLLNMFITFETNGKTDEIHLKSRTDLIQVVEGNPKAENISITAKGFGRAIARINYQYHSKIKNSKGGFYNINHNKTEINEEYFNLIICTSHNDNRPINNTIVEVDLPSGYIYHEEKYFKNSPLINRIEATKGGTHLNLYLAQITIKELCFNIPAFESFKVRNRQPVPIKVYSYYDKSKISLTSYE